MTVIDAIALAAFGLLFVAAYRIRRSPGGPLMFGLLHPRIAVVLASVSFGLAVAYIVYDALGDLPRALRPAFGEYLVRVATVAFLLGAALLAIAFQRRPRNARQAAVEYAKMLRLMGGSDRYLWFGVAVTPVLAVVGEWFNPVPSARFGVSGVVAGLGLLAPFMIVTTLRAFFFASNMPTVPEIAEAYAAESADTPTVGSST